MTHECARIGRSRQKYTGCSRNRYHILSSCASLWHRFLPHSIFSLLAIGTLSTKILHRNANLVRDYYTCTTRTICCARVPVEYTTKTRTEDAGGIPATARGICRLVYCLWYFFRTLQ